MSPIKYILPILLFCFSGSCRGSENDHIIDIIEETPKTHIYIPTQEYENLLEEKKRSSSRLKKNYECLLTKDILIFSNFILFFTSLYALNSDNPSLFVGSASLNFIVAGIYVTSLCIELFGDQP